MSLTVSFAQHQYYPRFHNRAEAIPHRDRNIQAQGQYYWAIRQCKWMDDRRKDRYGNPHFHVVKQPLVDGRQRKAKV